MRSRKLLQRRIVNCILYSITILSLVLSVIIALFSYQFTNKPLIPIDSKSICSKISRIDAEGDLIHIKLTEKVKSQHVLDLQNQISYETEAFSTLLVFPPTSFRTKGFNSSTVTGYFDYPFLQHYEGYLLCFSADEAKSLSMSTKVESNKFSALKSFPLSFDHLEFQKDSEYTQMKCLGDTIQQRYCVTKNLIARSGLVYFYSPIKYRFPTPFLSMSAQPIPSDMYDARLDSQPIVVQNNPLGEHPQIIKGISYYFCRGYNIGMLWHVLFDAVAPLYHTICSVEGKLEGTDRHFYFSDVYEVEVFILFMKIMSKYPMYNLLLQPQEIQFETCVLGLRKFNAKPAPFREEYTTFDFVYDPNYISFPEFRKLIMDYLKIKDTNSKNPLVILPLRRNNNTRYITNINSVIKTLEETCMKCEFLYINLDTLTIESQIDLMSKASAIVGVHGSGLAHEVWLKKSTKENPTFILEFLPPNYWCRNWYKSVADAFGIQYNSLYGKRVQFTDDLNTCTSFPERCPEVTCHDKLRDQNMFIDLDELKNAWGKIAAAFEAKK